MYRLLAGLKESTRYSAFCSMVLIIDVLMISTVVEQTDQNRYSDVVSAWESTMRSVCVMIAFN